MLAAVLGSVPADVPVVAEPLFEETAVVESGFDAEESAVGLPERVSLPGGSDSEEQGEFTGSLFDEYVQFTEQNPSWREDHGAGGIQLQVICPSMYVPEIELETPGAARAFDAWYETVYLGIGSAMPEESGPDPRIIIDPIIDDEFPPVVVICPGVIDLPFPVDEIPVDEIPVDDSSPEGVPDGSEMNPVDNRSFAFRSLAEESSVAPMTASTNAPTSQPLTSWMAAMGSMFSAEQGETSRPTSGRRRGR
ncbi:MAG: hypothetical protein ACKOEX_11070 [Planctomycetia bacterium]